jgi:hypothetical protein
MQLDYLENKIPTSAPKRLAILLICIGMGSGLLARYLTRRPPALPPPAPEYFVIETKSSDDVIVKTIVHGVNSPSNQAAIRHVISTHTIRELLLNRPAFPMPVHDLCFNSIPKDLQIEIDRRLGERAKE